MIEIFKIGPQGERGKRGLTGATGPRGLTGASGSESKFLTKISLLVAWLVILLAIVLVLTFIYWSYYPYKIIEFKDKAFPVITKEVKPGGQLIYLARACKKMNIGATVIRAFQDEIVYPLTKQESHRTMGCSDMKISINVPITLMPDIYKLKTDFVYQVNPIRNITITQYTEEFKVIE